MHTAELENPESGCGGGGDGLRGIFKESAGLGDKLDIKGGKIRKNLGISLGKWECHSSGYWRQKDNVS